MLVWVFLLLRFLSLTPEQRSLRARIAAHTLHSRIDSTAHTKPARDAALARFERQVDPDGKLPEAERQRRALAARTAYFTQLAYRSSLARSGRKAIRPDLADCPRTENPGGDSCAPTA